MIASELVTNHSKNIYYILTIFSYTWHRDSSTYHDAPQDELESSALTMSPAFKVSIPPLTGVPLTVGVQTTLPRDAKDDNDM